jgi:Cu2+-exporting ATPase
MVGINGQIAGLIDFRRTSQLRATSALEELRSKHGQALAIGLVSASDGARLQPLAASLGADFHKAGLSGSDLVQLIRGCRKRGLKVAYAGECLAKPRVAREADVAISLDTDALEGLDRNPAPIILLQPDLSKLAVLREATRIYNRRVKVAQGSALIPNLFCVAGALFLGLTSTATVIVTNLGTYSTYARTTASIRGLERKLAKSSPFREARNTSG